MITALVFSEDMKKPVATGCIANIIILHVCHFVSMIDKELYELVKELLSLKRK